MTYKSHLSIGLACWALYCGANGVPVASQVGLLGAGIVALFSLLPDIDHPKSWIGRAIPILPKILYATFGHRGMTHSVFAIASICLIFDLGGADRWVMISAFVGYSSHIFSDFFADKGIELFWPWRTRVAFPFTVKTGAFSERMAAIGFCGGVGLFLYGNHLPWLSSL